jgi:hypothetical protein
MSSSERNAGHFMSVVINVSQGEVNFTNSLDGDGNFLERSKSYLLPALRERFNQEFIIIQTPESKKMRQIGDLATCNFHAMLNNIIWVLLQRGQDMPHISEILSQVFGAKIVGKNIEDLIKQCAGYFENEEQKANLQKRMILAAEIYRKIVGEIYAKSQHHSDLEGLIAEKTKYNAFLSSAVDALSQESQHYNQLAGLIAFINNTKLDSIISNNFSLNPDLKLIYDREGLRILLFDKDHIIGMLPDIESNQLIIDFVIESFIIIDAIYLSISEEIKPEHIKNTIDAIKEGEAVKAFLQSYKIQQHIKQSSNLSLEVYDERQFIDQIKATIVSCGDDKSLALKSVIDMRYGRDENNALHVAAMVDDCEMIRCLVDIGFPIDMKNYFGCNALHLALDKNAGVETIEILLGLGINPDFVDELWKRSSFHFACLNLDPEIIQLLIEEGANINLRDGEKMTGLGLALRSLNNQDEYKSEDFEAIKIIIEDKNFEATQEYFERLDELYARVLQFNELYLGYVLEIRSLLETKLAENSKHNQQKRPSNEVEHPIKMARTENCSNRF